MRMSLLSLFVAALAVTPPGLSAQNAGELPTIEAHTAGMTALEGFVDLYWDERSGRLFAEFDQWDREFLYQIQLASGLGSNPVGLDRGQLGDTHVVRPERIGPRVLLVERNHRYRARSENPEEVRAVADAFAPSIVWGFDIVAASGDRALVDATGFFLRDAHGVARTLDNADQGDYTLDLSRSAFHLPRTKAFPLNTEVETLLTFTAANPGQLVRSVAADAQAVTLRERHSLVALPEDGYLPREIDPRIGALGPTFFDYAQPIDEAIDVNWVARHRLEKRDPSAERSEPVEPIVYYVDSGAPEPIRSALIDGASWWNEAFEAAGYIDAFRVEVLPDGADPQDIRYNMIHWTHRSTRGWSYGSSVVDPRTGEILKGNVNLGSLRVRQDYLKGLGYAPPFTSAMGSYCSLAAAPGFEYLAQVDDAETTPVDMALARVRQLSAHEVGHTLGFPHNYIASTYGRASVMDYPAPFARITADGRLDLSEAYASGIGEYDTLAVRWLYGDFADGTDEQAALDAIVQEGLDRGLRFMDHTDNAFVGAAHEHASVWDNGADLVEGLAHELEVRRIGLAHFGPEVLRQGEPLARLETVLVPLYLHHRFQLNAAIQSLGGADYAYALRGDGQTPVRIVDGAKQRRVLELALSTLDVAFLALPQSTLEMIPPPSYRMDAGEPFDGHTGLTFDALTAAATGAQYTVEALLHPDRMARLVEYGSRGDYPDLDEVVGALIDRTWKAPAAPGEYERAVQETVQRVVLDALVGAAADPANPALVRAVLSDHVLSLADWLEGLTDSTAHQRLAVREIRRWERNPEHVPLPGAPEIPPGSPIGG